MNANSCISRQRRDFALSAPTTPRGSNGTHRMLQVVALAMLTLAPTALLAASPPAHPQFEAGSGSLIQAVSQDCPSDPADPRATVRSVVIPFSGSAIVFPVNCPSGKYVALFIGGFTTTVYEADVVDTSQDALIEKFATGAERGVSVFMLSIVEVATGVEDVCPGDKYAVFVKPNSEGLANSWFCVRNAATVVDTAAPGERTWRVFVFTHTEFSRGGHGTGCNEHDGCYYIIASLESPSLSSNNPGFYVVSRKDGVYINAFWKGGDVIRVMSDPNTCPRSGSFVLLDLTTESHVACAQPMTFSFSN